MNKREAQKFDLQYSKFLQILQLQGYADSTIEAYSHAIRRISKYFDRCPDRRLTKDELKTYFSDLLKTHSWSTIKRDRNGIQRYYEHVLEIHWDWVSITKPPQVRSLPDILSPEEINRILNCVEKPRYAVLFYTLYTLGLRIGEGLNLQVGDIDYAHKRVHIRLGKGKKSRYVKLPEATYQLLRQFWATHRHPKLIFPSCQQHRQNVPMDRGAAQVAIRKACESAGIKKHITTHNFRHCFATHLIELGLNLRAVQDLLGHEDPRTTAIYTQLTNIVQQDALNSVNTLANRISSPLNSGEQS